MLGNLIRSRKAKGCLFIMGSFFAVCCVCVFMVGSVAEPIVAPFREVVVAFNAGMSHYEQAEYDEALVYFEQALLATSNIKRDLSPLPSDQAEIRTLEGMLLGMIGTAYHKQGQYKPAVDAYEQSLTIFRETEIDQQVLVWMNQIIPSGIEEGYSDQPLQALEVRLLNNLGVAYIDMGRYQQALQSYSDVLAIRREAGDKIGEATTLNNMANVYHFWGRYQPALQTFFEVLAILQEVGNQPEEESAALNNIAATYSTLGQSEQALAYLDDALKIANQLDDPVAKAAKFNNIGLAYANLGRYEEALHYFEQTLKLLRNNNQPEEGVLLDNIGAMYTLMGQYEHALIYHQQALAIFRETGRAAKEALALDHIGSAYSKQDIFEKALNYYQQSLTITQEIGEQQRQMATLSHIGYVYQQQRDTTQAITSYEQAVDIMESMQSEIKVEELKASFISENVVVYQHLIDLLWAEGDFEKVFNVVERARARAFLDQLANGRVDYRAGNEALLLQKEQTRRDEIRATRAQLLALFNRPSNEWNKEAIANTKAELEAQEQEYSQFLSELQIQSPEIASLVTVDVASLAEIQSRLPADTTLVEYFVTEERTLAFLITRESFLPVSLPVRREELVSAIKNFRLLDLANLEAGNDETLLTLHRWLMADLLPSLKTPRLLIVPHNVLHYLPFAALTDGQRYLSDDYALSVLPSASVLRFMQEKSKPETDTILALGNPSTEEPLLGALPFAEQEAQSVANLYGTQPLVGPAATESTFRQAKDKGILHLAAHGQYNQFNPLFSTIYLAADEENDGRLDVHEIYGLDLTSTTNLVVLSACQSQIGEVSGGDEVVALNRAFIYAGTPSVMASLWNVDDQATALFMQHFYTHLRADMGNAEALRQAQIDLRAEYAHPYYWAAFVLTDDGER